MNTQSQQSLNQIYQKHFPLIQSRLYRVVHCWSTAEELTQEAYVKVSESLKVKQIQYIQAYLYQTANNLALDHLRKQVIRKGPVDCEEETPAISSLACQRPSPEQSAVLAGQITLLESAINGLSARRKEILILHKIHRWKYKKIALHLGITVSAVEKNIRLALEHCLNIVDEI